MIKSLQKKFILSSMTAITVLLTVLLGVLNIASYAITDKQSRTMLDMLSENEGTPRNRMNKATEKPEKIPLPDLLIGAISEDNAMSARFFLVKVSASDGKIIITDVGRISSVTETEAEEYALQVISSGETEGKIKNFRYKVSSSRNGEEIVAVFLDISNDNRSVFMILAISVSVGIVCWCLMLLLVILLSKKAIYPIAENIEKQKQFVTNAGHEIKTPLAIILANTDALELHTGETKWSSNIRTQTSRLNGLMQNLLTLSKMDESSLNLPLSDGDISSITEDALNPFFELAAQNGIKISTDIESAVHADVNKDAFSQLLSILLDNAVKYSESGGKIDVSVKKRDKSVIITVKNVCSELPDENPSRLFDRFYRGDSARTQKNGGYGIGLSAAKAIAEALKGSINASYDSEKVVSFTVKLDSKK